MYCHNKSVNTILQLSIVNKLLVIAIMNYNLTSKGLLLSNNNSSACVKILRRYFFRETAAYNKLNYILLLFAKQKFFKNASHGSFAGDKAL